MTLTRSILYIVLVVAGLGGLAACGDTSGHQGGPSMVIQGETMGTYYRITYEDSLVRDFQPQIDSLLQAINAEVSTYIPDSDISKFNRSVDSFWLGADRVHFVRNFAGSQEVYALTGGAFDPTVMPLVNYWGFGYTPKVPVERIDSVAVDSLRKLVGFIGVQLFPGEEGYLLTKAVPGQSLDFSAIAKGYAVDIIGEFLEVRSIRNFLVDIGGEVLARGHNPRHDPWQIGVNKPDESSQLNEFFTVISLQDCAMATSGNYRNFHEVGGIKYSHTINPLTGFPERNQLLSVTVIADDCMRADALATACMVIGLDASKDLIEGLPNVESLLIFGNDAGGLDAWHSSGMGTLLRDQEEN